MTTVIGNEATLRAWLDAEASLKPTISQPPNSYTSEQYAKIRGITQSRARAILHSLWKAGKAKREKFYYNYAYTLVNEKR